MYISVCIRLCRWYISRYEATGYNHLAADIRELGKFGEAPVTTRGACGTDRAPRLPLPRSADRNALSKRERSSVRDRISRECLGHRRNRTPGVGDVDQVAVECLMSDDSHVQVLIKSSCLENGLSWRHR